MAVEEAACCAATTIMKHFEKIVVGIGCTLVAETNTCGLWHFLTASKSTKRSISSLRGLMLSGLKSVCETPIGQDHGSFFRCQTAPWKYSYMLGGMVSLCSLAMCLRTISEYRKRSPQMRQCHWSRAKMYGRHSKLFGSSFGSGILIIHDNPNSTISVRQCPSTTGQSAADRR